MIVNAANLMAYDCTDEDVQVTRFNAHNVEKCIKDTDEINIYHREVQVIQEKKRETIKVFHCFLSKISLLSHCGVFSHISLVAGGLSRQLIKISASECRDIHVTNKYKYAGTDILELKSNTTKDVNINEIGVINSDASCQGVKIEKGGITYENAIMVSTITITLEDYFTTIDTKTQEVFFEDGTTCQVNDGQCFSTTKGMSFWDFDINNKCDKTAKDILYEGPAVISSQEKIEKKENLLIGDVVTIETKEKLMTLEIVNTDHMCYQIMYKTDFSRISVIIKSPIYGFYFEKSNHIIPENLDLPMYLNAKFYYMAKNFESQIRNLHREVKYASCQASRDNILNKLQLARQQEVSYSHILTGEKGYMTMLSGDTFISVKCTPILAEIRKTETCHKNLPVSYKNKSMYIETNGRVLTMNAAEIPCTQLAPAVFHIAQNTWISAGKYMNYAKKPLTLKPNLYVQDLKFQDIKKYMAAGIYSNDQLEAFSEFVRHPGKRKSANNYITETIIKNQGTNDNFHITNILSPEELTNLKNSFLKEAEEKLLKFGALMGAITGFILIIQIIRYLISVIINFKFLQATLGSGLHLLASLFTSLTNYVIRNNVAKNAQENKGKELEKVTV